MIVKKNYLAKTGLYLVIIASIGKFVGLGRELIIAKHFGTSQELDNYLLASTVPILIISILMYTVPSIIIPRLNRIYSEEGAKEFNNASSFLVTLFSIILVVIALLIGFSSSLIIKQIAPTISNSNLQDTVYILKILMVQLVIGGLFPVIKGIFHTQKQFVFPAMMPISIHITTIICIFLFAENYGNKSIALGIVIGSIIQSLTLILFSSEYGIKLKPFFQNKYFHNIYSTVLAVFFIEFIGQFYSIIDRYFASQITGAVSALNYGRMIIMLPIAIFGISVSSTIFPSLSEYALKNNTDKLKSLFNKSLLVLTLISIPTVLIFFYFPESIVKTILERGAFSHKSTIITGEIVKYYSLGIIFFMFHTIFTKIYYSLSLERILLVISILAMMVKIYLSNFLFKLMAQSGLPVATSISFFIAIILLWIYLWWYLKKS